MGAIDVLVVGAGPTGLLAAAELARHKARVRIIDRAAVPSDHSRALALHARSLEVLEDLGVLREAMAAGRRVEGVSLYDRRQRVARIDMDGMDTPYPFFLSLPQTETERLLTAHLATLGVEVERGVTLVGLSQDEHGVGVDLELPDGQQERQRVPFVVGCDGVKSAVRGALGMGFDGVDQPARFALVDVSVHGPLSPDDSHTFFTQEGVVFFLALPPEGRWRLMLDISAEPTDAELDLAFFQRVLRRRLGDGLIVSDPQWSTAFVVRQRRAERFQKGRVFLAGDAAHAYGPVGGQGLNTGLQDAYNLAWKLALVIRGVARPELLGSYDSERGAVADAVSRGADQSTRLVAVQNPLGREIRGAVARLLSGFDGVQQRLALTLGELSVGYRHSPVVEERSTGLLKAQWIEDRSKELPTLSDRKSFEVGPRAGDRAPDAQLLRGGALTRLFGALAGTHHSLLLFDGQASTPLGYEGMARLAQAITERYGALVQVLAVVPGREVPASLKGRVDVLMDPGGDAHQRYGAGAECAYVVRPDGYIGFRSQPIDAHQLDSWLARIFLG